MPYALFADLVLIVHLGFVAFVVLGGLLVLHWRRLAWLHLPAVTWGVWVEMAAWPCPLTPLEQWLRNRAGQAGYSGGFVEHYVLRTLYPAELTHGDQLLIGAAVLLINGIVYAAVYRHLRGGTRR
jgi:hypothetical protein